MAISRLKTWANAEVLTAADLNGEFNNIINNALSLVSPLTGNLDVNNFRLNNLNLGTVGSPAVNFSSDTNTGIFSSAVDTVDVTAGGVRAASFTTVAGGVNFLELNPSVTTAAVTLDAEGTDANISINIRPKGTGTLQANGTPLMNLFNAILGVQIFS
ncbi:MAG: hypothetical protein ACRD5H_01090 [Nitrososphaerales archaeon]